MTAGRKSLPDNVKILRGTNQKVRMKNNDSVFVPVNKLPPAPDFLNNEGKKIYSKIGKYLLDLKILNAANLLTFSALCREFGIYWEAELSMKNLYDRWVSITDSQGNKRTVATAQHKISKEALANAVKLASEFGLTPASMSKISAQPEKKKISKFD